MQILGPLVLRVDGEPVSLGPRQRILLLALLVARGQAVTTSRLADMLWSGDAPDGWSVTLRSHIHHLRRTLCRPGARPAAAPRAMRRTAERKYAHPALLTERLGDGYAYSLRLRGEEVDAARFERLVADGRRALNLGLLDDGSGLLGDALGLWRGQPLADAAGLPFALEEARRLQEMHRVARLARIGADVRRGLHYEAIGELEAMLRHWPDDDGLRHLLVVCLHRGGRTAQAARVCRDGIELMLAHGLDTSCLQALQRQILGPPAVLPVPSL